VATNPTRLSARPEGALRTWFMERSSKEAGVVWCATDTADITKFVLYPAWRVATPAAASAKAPPPSSSKQRGGEDTNIRVHGHNEILVSSDFVRSADLRAVGGADGSLLHPGGTAQYREEGLPFFRGSKMVNPEPSTLNPKP